MESDFINLTDDIDLLLDLLPVRIRDCLVDSPDLYSLTEIVLDLGYKPEVRFAQPVLRLSALPEVTSQDIQSITSRIGRFNSDNRAGIERTLHRIYPI